MSIRWAEDNEEDRRAHRREQEYDRSPIDKQLVIFTSLSRSDGTLPPEKVLKTALTGVLVIALTDHDLSVPFGWNTCEDKNVLFFMERSFLCLEGTERHICLFSQHCSAEFQQYCQLGAQDRANRYDLLGNGCLKGVGPLPLQQTDRSGLAL